MTVQNCSVPPEKPAILWVHATRFHSSIACRVRNVVPYANDRKDRAILRKANRRRPPRTRNCPPASGMLRRRKIDPEKVLSSLNVTCPHEVREGIPTYGECQGDCS